MGEQAEQTEGAEFWPTKHLPEHDPEDGDQSDEAISLLELGIEESKAKRKPYIEVQIPDGTSKGIGRFLNTKFFWDLEIDSETRREIIAKYTKIAEEYSPLGLVPPLFETEETETPAAMPESEDASLPRITLPPEVHDTKPDPYEGKDWAQRAAGEKNEDD